MTNDGSFMTVGRALQPIVLSLMNPSNLDSNPPKPARLALLGRNWPVKAFRTISLVRLPKNDIVAQILNLGVGLWNIALGVVFASV